MLLSAASLSRRHAPIVAAVKNLRFRAVDGAGTMAERRKVLARIMASIWGRTAPHPAPRPNIIRLLDALSSGRSLPRCAFSAAGGAETLDSSTPLVALLRATLIIGRQCDEHVLRSHHNDAGLPNGRHARLRNNALARIMTA